MSDKPPRDRGLQPERTAMSWRRTALSVAVGSLAAVKVLSGSLGAAGVLLSVFGVLWSVDLALVARRRYGDARTLMATPTGQGVAAAVAGPAVVRTLVVTLALGAACLACVVALALGR